MSSPLVLVTLSVLIRSEAARGCVGKGCGIVLLGVLASIGLWILGDVLDSSSSPVTPDSPATKSRPPSSSPSVRTPPVPRAPSRTRRERGSARPRSGCCATRRCIPCRRAPKAPRPPAMTTASPCALRRPRQWTRACALGPPSARPGRVEQGGPGRDCASPPGLEPRMTVPKTVVLPITPWGNPAA